MHFKREEPFRFLFETPIVGTFSIAKYDNKEIDSKPGPLSVIDLSPKGIKIITPLDLPIFNHQIQLKISFYLNEKPIHITGLCVWKEKRHTEYLYGIEAFNDMEEQAILITELKTYAKKKRDTQ